MTKINRRPKDLPHTGRGASPRQWARMLVLLLAMGIHFRAGAAQAWTASAGQAMWLGLPVQVTIWAKDDATGQKAVAASKLELDRLEQSYSPFRQGSLVNELNQYGGERPVRVDAETIRLLQWCLDLSGQTHGALDITSAVYLWEYGFGQDHRIPGDLRLRQLQPLVNDRFVALYPKDQTVLFKRQGMQIDLSMVLPNYAFDCLGELWKKNRVQAACCQINGSLLVFGSDLPPALKTWQVPFPGQKNVLWTEIPLAPGKWLRADIFSHSFELEGRHVHPFLDVATGRPTTAVQAAVLYLPPNPKLNLPVAALLLLPPEQGARLAAAIPNSEYLILDARQQLFRSRGWAPLECHLPPPQPLAVKKRP